MKNQPIDKGRVSVIVEKYQTRELDQSGQQVMKNRYANVGRATLWPNKHGSNMPNVEIEIDTMPVGVTGVVKMYIFWDSDKSNQPQQPQYNQQPQQQYNQNQNGNNPTF